MYARVVTITKLDLRPILSIYVFKARTDVPKDLTGVLNVKFWMKNLETDVVKINGVAGSIAQVSPGILTYTWVGTDTDTVGRYSCWMKGYYGATNTNPMTIIGPEIWIVDDGGALVT